MITDKLLSDFRKNLMRYGSLEYPSIARKIDHAKGNLPPSASSSSSPKVEPSDYLNVIASADGTTEDGAPGHDGAKRGSQEGSQEGSRESRRAREVTDSGKFDGW